jgi:hypothetical protein
MLKSQVKEKLFVVAKSLLVGGRKGERVFHHKLVSAVNEDAARKIAKKDAAEIGQGKGWLKANCVAIGWAQPQHYSSVIGSFY